MAFSSCRKHLQPLALGSAWQPGSGAVRCHRTHPGALELCGVTMPILVIWSCAVSPCPSQLCPIHGTPGAGTPPHHCWARAAPGALPPLPAGCSSATEAKAALINYELKHFPSWLFTRAASLLIRNNTKEGAFKAHLFRGTLIRCQLGAPQCAPGGLGLWLRGQTPPPNPKPFCSQLCEVS